MTENLDKTNPQEKSAEEEPIVYAIQKDLKGWKFSRRDFLKGAVTTAEAAAVAGAIAGCGSEVTPEAAVATATAAPEAATEAPPTSTPKPTKTPTSTPIPQPKAIVNQAPISVRRGPGINYDILGVAKKDEEYIITGRLADNSWYQIDYQKQVGWLAGSLVTAENAGLALVITDIPPTNTATATPTPTQPLAIINTNWLAIRRGPGPDYEALEVADKGRKLVILGRLADKSWYQVEYKNQIGWVPSDRVKIQNADQVPVISDIPTPVPTSPGVKGTVQPGQTGINYTIVDAQGVMHKYTLPCGSPLPPGAVCVCNCVTSPRPAPRPTRRPTICTCDRVCTCDSQGGTYWYPN